MDDNSLLTTEQAAILLGITTSTLHSWRHRGQGPRYIKYERGKGRPVRYKLVDVQRYINNATRYTGEDNAGNTKH